MISESASARRVNGGGSLLMRHTPPLPRSRQDKRGRSIRPILPPLRLWRMFPLEGGSAVSRLREPLFLAMRTQPVDLENDHALVIEGKK